ncbi:LamG domain-containing protein [Neorhodopirellula pilleata]|uniref:LamG-like jellyroll fold domain-containing protein n=1 Tax=Neorhodopirellula pilleata TaxID=2714738 RepID=A0A5C6AD52_9BACT|nr:LamG domain-containing protein [Neorhodopirellula pilleata]TWT97336.1 hypothetical protein Pla100_24880 [Neorhodopirellula pilleata]
MTSDNDELNILRQLILKSQTETLSESEIHQLNQSMQSEAGAHEAAVLIDQLGAFCDSNNLDSSRLRELLNEACSPRSGVGVVSVRSRSVRSQTTDTLKSSAKVHSEATTRRRWSTMTWVIGLVASHLFVASLVWTILQSSFGSTSFEKTGLIDPSPQLVSMTACVWRPSGDSVPTLGEPLQLGEVLDLVEGIAELQIGEGTFGEALVRIEGPASVFIQSSGDLVLRQGSLTVKSLQTGLKNVSIQSPMGEVSVDGQSSIGMVASRGVDELHVFSGRALLHPNAATTVQNELRLEAGEAIRFNSNANGNVGVVMLEASMSRFVSARSSGFDPLKLGSEYVRAVMESQPSIYWRFEELAGEMPYYVKNEGSAPGMNAVLFGEPGWRQYGNNQVAELGKLGTSSGFRSADLWPPEPLDEYTIEFWFKPELYHHGEMLCMHQREQFDDGRYSHTLMLESLMEHWRNPLRVYQPNRIRFVHRSPASGEVTEGSNLIADRPYPVRTWQHLVAQKNGEQLMLWLDGRLADEKTDSRPLEAKMQFVIGQLYLTRAERRFVGQIDEIAIYDRCLTSEEIRGHMKAAGKAASVKRPRSE